MFNIYYTDGVNPSVCLHTCNTLKEAKDWISEQLEGYTMVDVDHQSTENVMASSKVALYQVYDGDPIAIGDDGKLNIADSVFDSDSFYTE